MTPSEGPENGVAPGLEGCDPDTRYVAGDKTCASDASLMQVKDGVSTHSSTPPAAPQGEAAFCEEGHACPEGPHGVCCGCPAPQGEAVPVAIAPPCWWIDHGGYGQITLRKDEAVAALSEGKAVVSYGTHPPAADTEALRDEVERLRKKANTQTRIIVKVYRRVALVVDGICDDDDRLYFGSSNDADILRDLKDEWDAHKIMGEDLLTAEQEAASYKARATKAEAERDAYRAVLEGAEYGDIDQIGRQPVALNTELGRAVKAATVSLRTERDAALARVAELEEKVRIAQNAQIARGDVFADTNPEAQYIADMEHACPACGGSGHKDDVAPAPQPEADLDALAHGAALTDIAALEIAAAAGKLRQNPNAAARFVVDYMERETGLPFGDMIGMADADRITGMAQQAARASLAQAPAAVDVDLERIAHALHDGPLMAADHAYDTASASGKWCRDVVVFVAASLAQNSGAA